jgi:hypothetical protein
MKKIIAGALILVFFAGCKKEEAPLPTVPQPVPVDDARTVLLKEVAAQSLPNPYFKYAYSAEKYVTVISFASGLAVYKVTYENKRVKKMTNIKNGHTMLYSYTNSRVSQIDEFDLANKKIFTYEMLYTAAGKLAQVNWKEFDEDPAGHLFKKVLLSYYADGNLSVMETYYASGNTMDLMLVRKFSDYDDKTNVDDFYMMDEFFDAFLFLPQVKLQLNNPRKEKIIGDVSIFEINYQYEFNNNLPIKKSGVMVQTTGPNAGSYIQVGYQFSYY